jgi:hypothetical protein
MRPRLVDWTLFVLVTVAILSGFGSFLVGQPAGWWVFVLHGIGGLALTLVLVWKVRRVWPRLVQPHRWDGATAASLAALVAVLAVLITGVVWVTWQWPARFPNGMWWHVALGILLFLFLVLHMASRFKRPRWHDLQGRRTVLHWLAMAAVGGLLWQGNQSLNRTLATEGARRRFTGSRQEGADFPVTMWMLDHPAPVDLGRWQLRIHGAVRQERTLALAEIDAWATDVLAATLDCTSGWYTTQAWQGVQVGRLLAEVQPTTGATWVSFRSITGYRWSLPLAEAREALLATHVAGTPLDHGHGAPLRLVAPGRRGFQWVKWVTEIQVLTAADYGQWAAIFVSGVRGR